MPTVMRLHLLFLFLFLGHITFASSSQSPTFEQEVAHFQLKQFLGAKKYNKLQKKLHKKNSKRRREPTPKIMARNALLAAVVGYLIGPLFFLGAIAGLVMAIRAKKRMREIDNYDGRFLADLAIIVALAPVIVIAIFLIGWQYGIIQAL